MSEVDKNSELVNEYASDIDIYKRMSAKVADLLFEILAREGVVVHAITHRCKEQGSLAKKISRPDKSYRSLAEITDLAGIRVTTYFATDVDKIGQIIEREFEIDKPNSIDRRMSIDPDRFGYQSLHYVALFSSTRKELIEYKKFSGKKFEIQIRSILQHAWAEIEHDLGYKSASGVPRDIRRRFARVAGLLEIADDEFGAIREELKHYEHEIAKIISQNVTEVDLDLPVVKSLYGSNSSAAALDKAIATVASAHLEEADLERILDRFHYFGINKVSELEMAVKQNHKLAVSFAEKWLNGKTYAKFPTGVGALYLGYVIMAAKEDKAAFVSYLNRFNIGHQEEREQDAERAMNIFKEVCTT